MNAAHKSATIDGTGSQSGSAHPTGSLHLDEAAKLAQPEELIDIMKNIQSNNSNEKETLGVDDETLTKEVKHLISTLKDVKSQCEELYIQRLLKIRDTPVGSADVSDVSSDSQTVKAKKGETENIPKTSNQEIPQADKSGNLVIDSDVGIGTSTIDALIIGSGIYASNQIIYHK